MKKIFRLLVLALLAGGWALAGSALYVIRVPAATDSKVSLRVALVPKDRLGFADTYVDARNWTLDDAARHPALTSRLIAAGKEGVLAHVADPNNPQPLKTQLIDAVQHGPRETKPVPASATAQQKPRWKTIFDF